MNQYKKPENILSQVTSAYRSVNQSIPFIMKHQLWKDFLTHKWILVMTIVVGAIFSYTLFNEISYALSEMVKGGEGSLEQTSSHARRVFHSGGMKYLLMIFFEVIIFHFVLKTMNIMNATDRKPMIRDFWNAEKRMFIVMLLSLISAWILHLLIRIGLSIFGYVHLLNYIMFFVHSFFLGLGFLDNYNEQQGFSIKQSKWIISEHKGAATGIGIIANILLFLPLLGPLIVPVICGIGAALYGHKHQIELTYSEKFEKNKSGKMKEEIV